MKRGGGGARRAKRGGRTQRAGAGPVTCATRGLITSNNPCRNWAVDRLTIDEGEKERLRDILTKLIEKDGMDLKAINKLLPADQAKKLLEANNTDQEKVARFLIKLNERTGGKTPGPEATQQAFNDTDGLAEVKPSTVRGIVRSIGRGAEGLGRGAAKAPRSALTGVKLVGKAGSVGGRMRDIATLLERITPKNGQDMINEQAGVTSQLGWRALKRAAIMLALCDPNDDRFAKLNVSNAAIKAAGGVILENGMVSTRKMGGQPVSSAARPGPGRPVEVEQGREDEPEPEPEPEPEAQPEPEPKPEPQPEPEPEPEPQREPEPEPKPPQRLGLFRGLRQRGRRKESGTKLDELGPTDQGPVGEIQGEGVFPSSGPGNPPGQGGGRTRRRR